MGMHQRTILIKNCNSICYIILSKAMTDMQEHSLTFHLPALYLKNEPSKVAVRMTEGMDTNMRAVICGEIDTSVKPHPIT